ncbi:MAG TPA: M28 family peptidase, partial [Thermoanaerobaculia bacterium]|nr:M28 family peptidase [Thermoanaerobaculia bacterium]
RRGAVASIIRSVGTGPHRFAHTGGTRYTEDDRVTLAVKPIPVAALSLPDADVLERRVAAAAAAGEPVRFHLELGARELPNEVSANVIAELRGRELPEEIVLLGCHLDSWDLGVGAVDDGSGCGIVAAAAQQIAELPRRPRRSVRVVLYANEEFGLSGALAYAERHADALDRHVLAFESDLGADRVWRFATAVAEDEVAHYEPLAAVLAPLGIEYQGNTGRGGADLIPLRRAGRPVADLTQDATRYFDVHHTDDDTMAMIDPEAVAQNVAAYATLAWWAADHPAVLGGEVVRE